MLIIDFDQANNLNLSNLVGKTSILKSFGASPDNKSMIIMLNNTGVKLRKFVGDNFTTGIDIFMDQGAEPYERKVVMRSSIPDGNEVIKGSATSTSSVLKSNIITFPKSYVGPPRIEQIYRLDEGFIGPLPKNYSDMVIYEIIKVYDESTIQIEIAETDDATLILFPFSDTASIGSAIKIDGKIITAIFSQQGIAISPNSYSKDGYIKNIEQIPNDKAIVVNIELDSKKLLEQPIKVLTYRNNYAWVAEIVAANVDDNQEFIVKPIRLEVSNEWGENSISVMSESIKGPYTIEDIKTGEPVKVFTVKENGTGVLMGREFVDLKIDESLQGIFLKEKSDFINYKIDEEKLYLTKLPNLIISDEIIATDFSAGDSGDEVISKTMGIFPEQSTFPFPLALKALEKLTNATSSTEVKTEETSEEEGVTDSNDKNDEDLDKGKEILSDEDLDKMDFYGSVVSYLDQIIQSSDIEKKSKAMLNLAEFYFSNGLYTESLGLLYDIIQDNPDFTEIFKVRATYAATLYLIDKFDEAYKEFSTLVDESLNNSSYNEFKLWKWFSLQQKNKKLRITEEPNVKIDFTASFDKFMQQYTPELKFDFGIKYIQHQIDKGRIEDAKNLLEIITYNGFEEKYSNYIKLMKAKFNILQKNEEEGIKALKEIISDIDDRKNRAKALFELTRYNLVNGIYSTKEAIDNFLMAATIWRDDYFELDIYETVGSLYLSEKEYMKALMSWEKVVSNFTQTTESIFVLGRMKDLFIELFDGSELYKLPTMEALKIYFKYRELIPAGEVGDRITRKMAEFFIDSDMVDDAIDIVLHQIKYRSRGDEKAKLALWLSRIYEQNRELQAAEDVLNIINEEENISEETKDLGRYRLAYIKAKQGLYNEGMELLKGDFSPRANRSRIELFWIRQNWFGIINLIEERMDLIKETAPEPLSKEELGLVLKLAIAYASQLENEKLAELKANFFDRLKGEDDIRLFEFLSSGDNDVDYRQFDESVELERIERFMNEYSFLPNNSWTDIIEILEPKVKLLIGKNIDNYTRQNRFDVVRLALAYTLLDVSQDPKLEQEIKKKMGNLARDFKNVHVDRFSIDAFHLALDDKFMPIESDAIFEGKIKITELSRFLEYYKNARKISELNQAVRNQFD